MQAQTQREQVGFGKRGVRYDGGIWCSCLASCQSCLGGGRSVDQPYLFVRATAL